MKIFSATLAKGWMPAIKMIATDMDGTITQDGKFDPRLLVRLTRLRDLGISVLIVTGRSAGWVSGLVEYLPVVGAIAENGGYLFTPEQPAGVPLIEMDDPHRFRQEQSQVFAALKDEYPHICPSADNQFRLTDWTFDNVNLSTQALDDMTRQCEALGWSLTYSSIQCHIKAPTQSKQRGLLKALKLYCPEVLKVDQILTIGDSPNDAELLDDAVFQYSVGVANIIPYLSTMSSQPHWVSDQAELLGFLDVTQGFLELG